MDFKEKLKTQDIKFVIAEYNKYKAKALNEGFGFALTLPEITEKDIEVLPENVYNEEKNLPTKIAGTRYLANEEKKIKRYRIIDTNILLEVEVRKYANEKSLTSIFFTLEFEEE